MTPTTTLPERPASEPHEEVRPRLTPPTRLPLPQRNVRPPGTRSGWAMRLIYLVSDLAAFASSLALAKWTVDAVLGLSALSLSVEDAKLCGLWLIGLIAVAAAQQTYAAIPPRPVRKFRGWVLGAITVCLAVVGAAGLLNVGSGPVYASLALASGLAVLLASFCRAVCRIVFGSMSWWGTRLVVVGSGDLAEQTHAALAREPQWGLRPVGYVGDGLSPNGSDEISHNLGHLDRLDWVAEKFALDWALVAVHSFDADELGELLSRANGRIKHWIILPPLERFPSLWLEACEAARRPALTVTNRLRQGWSLPLKRAFDFAVATVLALAVLPLVVLIAAFIRVGSPGPIFYGQERVGRFGRRFRAWKFRTMLPNADAVLERYLGQHPELAQEWQAKHKLRTDPRVTWVGRWLRSTSLDELPQVWNVLVGEMSLVGPRPIVAAEIEKYANKYEHYVQVLPGITGLWQVSGRNNTTYAERVALDEYYVQNWSLWLDIYILACTAKVVLLCEGAY